MKMGKDEIIKLFQLKEIQYPIKAPICFIKITKVKKKIMKKCILNANLLKILSDIIMPPNNLTSNTNKIKKNFS